MSVCIYVSTARLNHLLISAWNFKCLLQIRRFKNMGILADRQQHRCAIYIHMYIHTYIMHVCITCIYSLSYCRQTAEQEILRRISFEYLTRTRNNIILWPPGSGEGGRGIDCFIALLPACGRLLLVIYNCCWAFVEYFACSALFHSFSIYLHLLLHIRLYFPQIKKGILSQCFIVPSH